MEILHLLWLPGVPHVEKEEEEQGLKMMEEEPGEHGKCDAEGEEADGGRRAA